MKSQWELKHDSYSSGESGDYGCSVYMTDGKSLLLLSDEGENDDDETLQAVVDAMNKCNSIIHTDDSHELVINHYQEMIDNLEKEIEQLKNQIKL